MIIYKATNKINGKIYIGQTVKSISDRIKAHNKKSKNGSNTRFHRAIRKYGIGNFKWEILIYCQNKYWLDYYEKKLIIVCETKNKKIGYNLVDGGNTTLGYKMSIETRKKMSKMRKGKNNSFYGKKHTEESKQKNKLAHTGANSPVARKIKNIETAKIFGSISEAIKFYNIKNPGGLYSALRGLNRQKTSGGYHWEYAD